MLRSFGNEDLFSAHSGEGRFFAALRMTFVWGLPQRGRQTTFSAELGRSLKLGRSLELGCPLEAGLWEARVMAG